MTLLQFGLVLAFVAVVTFCGGGHRAIKNLFIWLVLSASLYLTAGTFARYTDALTGESHWRSGVLLLILAAAILGVTIGSVVSHMARSYWASRTQYDLFSRTPALYATRGFDPDTGAPRPIRILSFDDSDLA